MSLGSYRQDRMQRITGGFYDFAFQEEGVGAGDGAFYVDTNFSSAKYAAYWIRKVAEKGDGFWFDSSRVTRTGAETEPKNTALHYYIYVY